MRLANVIRSYMYLGMRSKSRPYNAFRCTCKTGYECLNHIFDCQIQIRSLLYPSITPRAGVSLRPKQRPRFV
jgi:hypothetical protein